MKCEICKYEWEPRTEIPVACPRCRRRFDYPTPEELKRTKEDVI